MQWAQFNLESYVVGEKGTYTVEGVVGDHMPSIVAMEEFKGSPRGLQQATIPIKGHLP